MQFLKMVAKWELAKGLFGDYVVVPYDDDRVMIEKIEKLKIN